MLRRLNVLLEELCDHRVHLEVGALADHQVSMDADEIDGTTASKLKSTWRAPDFSPAFAKTLRVMKLLVGEAAGVDPITGEGRARARRERMTTSDSKTRTSATNLAAGKTARVARVLEARAKKRPWSGRARAGPEELTPATEWPAQVTVME